MGIRLTFRCAGCRRTSYANLYLDEPTPRFCQNCMKPKADPKDSTEVLATYRSCKQLSPRLTWYQRLWKWLIGLFEKEPVKEYPPTCGQCGRVVAQHKWQKLHCQPCFEADPKKFQWFWVN